MNSPHVCRVHVNAHLTQGSTRLTDPNLKVDTFRGELFFLSYFTVYYVYLFHQVLLKHTVGYEGAILIVE